MFPRFDRFDRRSFRVSVVLARVRLIFRRLTGARFRADAIPSPSRRKSIIRRLLQAHRFSRTDSVVRLRRRALRAARDARCKARFALLPRARVGRGGPDIIMRERSGNACVLPEHVQCASARSAAGIGAPSPQARPIPRTLSAQARRGRRVVPRRTFGGWVVRAATPNYLRLASPVRIRVISGQSSPIAHLDRGELRPLPVAPEAEAPPKQRTARQI